MKSFEAHLPYLGIESSFYRHSLSFLFGFARLNQLPNADACLCNSVPHFYLAENAALPIYTMRYVKTSILLQKWRDSFSCPSLVSGKLTARALSIQISDFISETPRPRKDSLGHFQLLSTKAFSFCIPIPSLASCWIVTSARQRSR
jgi:hypothetical protein